MKMYDMWMMLHISLICSLYLLCFMLQDDKVQTAAELRGRYTLTQHVHFPIT